MNQYQKGEAHSVLPKNKQAGINGDKPFRLVNYFTFPSLIVMFLGTIVLSGFSSHWVRNMIQKKSEAYALLLVENLNHQIFSQFVIPVVLKYGKIQLRNKDQFERMDRVVRSTLHSFKIDMVNIYDRNNVISYSFDPDIIGEKDVGGREVVKAIDGETSSNLVQQGSFWELLRGVPRQSRVVTYAPLRAEKGLASITGPVLGVVEIVQDVSDDYKIVSSLQILEVTLIVMVMGILFLILRSVVKRGEKIIGKRNEERLRLEEQLSRAKHLSSLGEMTAGVSHEIRNPLGIIMSSAGLMKKKMARLDPTSTIPSIILEEAGRLNDIITDFLNYARPRVPDLSPCDVVEVLDKNISFLSVQMESEGYEIHKRIEGSIPEITADGTMLYQAFLNILINGMQAMPGGGEINVAAAADQGRVRLVFEDRGGGIPGEVLENIWNPFFTTKEKGTGLGLGIVRNFIEAHYGTIGIENRSGGGVRVVVELPEGRG